MRILAIETSCDETAAAVVTNGQTVESNVVSTQIEAHRITGGVVPEVAARLQMEAIIPVIEQALKEAKAGWDDIDAIAVTFGPGLAGSLIVGVETAKALAFAKQKPLIPVNHLAGHLYACFAAARHSGRSGAEARNHQASATDSRLRGNDSDFDFPYLGLIASGGHTEFVMIPNHHEFEIVGSTRDDAAGEAFDKVGKLLGLPYPGGPEISKLAKRGDPKAIDFPRAMLDQDNLDMSFSGLKTAVSREVATKKLTAKRKADIAASFQAAVIDTLVRKTLAAVRLYHPNAVLLGGGVAANESLRRALNTALTKEKIPLLVTPKEYATDNAAMIGLAAYWQRDQALTEPDVFSVGVWPRAALASPTA
ncbi:tRNA (adenosine(37)-N6)-threonylcarbamoyltransferase complex transferase subunit TsaD [Patescibacteria group bacterium]|nr:tRNA (adenosine(37)-N6)-threonylcarbamoyltransferase complex transferase subunit TsaD [Patescibacteria group bacterium]